MFAWRRRLPPSSVVAFLAAGSCAVLAFVLVRAEIAAGRADGASAVKVVVAAHDLDPGIALSATDLAERSLGVAIAPPGAIERIADAVQRVTVTPFLEGEIVSRTRLASGSGPASVGVPPGSVAVTIVPDLAPPGIGPGDRVDVLATYTTARPYTATAAAGVVVLAVVLDDGAFGGGAGLTLITDPFTAAELARADATARLTIAVLGYEPMPEPSPSPG